MPCLIEPKNRGDAPSLGQPDVDDYLRFVAARARRNTLLATAYDLKVFFTVVGKAPADVTTRDVLAFLKHQRAPRRGPGVNRLEDGEAGLSARTVKRRLTSVSGLFAYLIARGDAGITDSSVPRGLATRHSALRGRGVPLIRTPRTLPRVLSPADMDALLGSLRTARDRAMVQAMLLGAAAMRGPRPNAATTSASVSGVCSSPTARADTTGSYHLDHVLRHARRLSTQRASRDSHHEGVLVLKGPRRGQPLSSTGLDEIIRDASRRSQVARSPAISSATPF